MENWIIEKGLKRVIFAHFGFFEGFWRVDKFIIKIELIFIGTKKAKKRAKISIFWGGKIDFFGFWGFWGGILNTSIESIPFIDFGMGFTRGGLDGLGGNKLLSGDL